MKNVKLVAGKFKELGVFYKGIKTFSVNDDVVTIEMGDGRIFSSPIDQLRGTYESVFGFYFFRFIWKRKYKLYNPQGEVLLTNYSDWDGFHVSLADHRKQIYDILDSAPNVKPTAFEKFRRILAFINWLFWISMLIYIWVK